MSAYEIKLTFQVDSIAGAHAQIAVRDPLWERGEYLAVTPDCMTADELRYWGDRAKGEIDKAVAAGARKFGRIDNERGARR